MPPTHRTSERSALHNIFLWSLVCLLVGGTGLVLAYGPVASKAWTWEFGLYRFNGSWRAFGELKEFLRLVVIVLLAGLGHAHIFRRAALEYWQGSLHPLAFYRALLTDSGRRTRMLVAAVVVALVLYHAVVGPIQLHGEYSELYRSSPDAMPPPWSFREYQAPYLCYMLYSAVMYGLVGIPMLVVMLRGLRTDRSEIKGITDEIQKARPDRLTATHVGHFIERTRSGFLDIRERLVVLVDRYFFAFAIIVLYVAFELRYTVETLQCWAQDLLLWSAWAFVLLVVPGFVVMAFRAHGRAASMRRETLERAREEVWDRPELADALGMVNDQREQAAKEGSPVAFLWSLRKSGIVGAMVLVLAFGTARKVFEPAIGEVGPVVYRILPRPLPALVHRIGAGLTASADSAGESRAINLGEGCERNRPELEAWEEWLRSEGESVTRGTPPALEGTANNSADRGLSMRPAPPGCA